MNGYERINAALKGEKTDKVPIMLHNFMMAAKEHGITMEQYRENPKLIAECFIASVDKYKFDGILVDVDTVTLAGAVGVPVDFPVNDPAHTHIGNLQNLEDIASLKPAKVEDYKYIQIWLEAVTLLKNIKIMNSIFAEIAIKRHSPWQVYAWGTKLDARFNDGY